MVVPSRSKKYSKTVEVNPRSDNSFPEIQKTLNTRELAACFHVEAQTVRRAFCVSGHYMGLKPLKLPNKRLLWHKADVIRVLGGACEQS